MISVMLVDDEYMILKGLQLLIDWEGLGLHIVKAEQNPVAALAYLKDHPVDILLSDMSMPEMAGPEFVKAVREAQPDIALIVVSGYADFQYVKAGLQAQAINYLTKPIDPDELVAALRTAKTQLNERQQADAAANLAAQTQTRILVNGDASAQTHAAEALHLHLGVAHPPVQLIAILNPLPPTDLVTDLQTTPEVIGFFREDKDFVVVLQADPRGVQRFLNGLPASAQAKTRPVLVGPVLRTLAALPPAIHQLRTEIARQYFFEAAAGLQWLTPNPETAPMLPRYADVESALAQLEPAGIRRWLEQHFTALKSGGATVEMARQFALIVLMVLNARQTAADTQAETVGRINDYTTVSGLVALLVDRAQAIARDDSRQYSRNVQAARKIVHQRYMEPLTLLDVGQELHLNAAYLGQLFKQETNRSFAEYLNDWRIGIAIEKLRDSEEDITVIADSVGYHTPSYFFKRFKQQTGMSPREYRAAARLG